ncbi:hypothetical protein J2J97_32285 (plasmid) [Rhizobium bangladeshense]|uniref:hypothetical protein n=1 Tax=Rhizobium bangladeshense TaxID=1138189 RepID=UPI001A97DF4A|nr:hypothetical protein [Rhizobium bangladeshense]QSY98584.1 hypothetical protein J2J97_32285 [Rhizobium bangladeshense]
MIKVIYQDGSEGRQWEVGDWVEITRNTYHNDWLKTEGKVGWIVSIRDKNQFEIEVRWTREWGPWRGMGSSLRPMENTRITGVRHTQVIRDPNDESGWKNTQIIEGPIMPATQNLFEHEPRAIQL